MQREEAWKELQNWDRKIQILTQVLSVLEWDQETFLPDGGIEDRSEQFAEVQRILHETVTGSQIEALLANAAVRSESEEDTALLKLWKRRYESAVKLPEDLVTRLARQTSLAHHHWIRAREGNDFSLFAPFLESVVLLTREKAEKLDFTSTPYDPLLDEYEPWTMSSDIDPVLSRLETGLRELLAKIEESDVRVEAIHANGRYSVKLQKKLAQRILEDMGYDFNQGRMDVSAHPMTISLGRSDVRLTNRYDCRDFTSAVSGAAHEGGHALYALGIADSLAGTSLGESPSMGMDESQSRLWENMIGRSKPFWEHYLPIAKETFPNELSNVTLDGLYTGINKVMPSLIRVEADEVTYNLHILLRYRLEKRLIEGDFNVNDLPEAWHEESRLLLGVASDTDADGCLQDIHWSMGYFGYFPTYTLGNLYGAQIFATMKDDMSDWEKEIKNGHLIVIREWLREKIHKWGSIFPAQELCRKVTGETISSSAFLSYLNKKYGEIYGL